MAEETVRYALEGEVAVVRLDDGRANGISHAVVQALHDALDRAEKEAKAVLVVGREGRFSGGFDLAVMRSGPDEVRALVLAGAKLFLRLYAHPQPIVVACTGHAVAAGAIVLLASDARIGAAGEFKIGLNEVGIGMSLPMFAFELARERLSKRHFTRATTQAELYRPDDAVDAGFLDRVVAPEELFDASLEEAVRLAKLPQPAFGSTKAAVHATVLETLRATLEKDIALLTGGPQN